MQKKLVMMLYTIWQEKSIVTYVFKNIRKSIKRLRPKAFADMPFRWLEKLFSKKSS